MTILCNKDANKLARITTELPINYNFNHSLCSFVVISILRQIGHISDILVSSRVLCEDINYSCTIYENKEEDVVNYGVTAQQFSFKKTKSEYNTYKNSKAFKCTTQVVRHTY